MSKLLVHQMAIGPADNFIYFWGDAESKEVAIVDPAWDVPFILSEAERLGLTITMILLTHGHGDHVNGVADMLASHDIPVYLSADEHEKYRPKVDLIDMHDGDQLTIGNVTFDVLSTPGHSPGGVCFRYENHMIVGDTLFIDGCGRCDLVGSDVNAMYDSIHGRLMTQADDTIIYVGHNYGPTATDTIGNQKKTNRFMLAASREAFVKERLG